MTYEEIPKTYYMQTRLSEKIDNLWDKRDKNVKERQKKLVHFVSLLEARNKGVQNKQEKKPGVQSGPAYSLMGESSIEIQSIQKNIRKLIHTTEND